MTSRVRVRADLARQRGMAMIWSMAGSLMIGGLILAATDEMRALNDISNAEFSASGQAQSVAEAGVVDAYAWFRRQSVQPVLTFAPKRDLSADPQINETDDPTVGLVREFQLSPALWGRYEVRKGIAAETWTDQKRNGYYDAGEPFIDTNGDGRWTPASGTRDVTSDRGLTGAGTVWILESIGRVYRRPDENLPLGEGPNRQIASHFRQTEIRRMAVTLPASAAIQSSRADNVRIGSRTRIRSSTVGVAYKSLTGLPIVSSLAEILGGTLTAGFLTWRDGVTDVFGLDWTELQSIADISTADGASLPAQLPDASLVVLTGNAVFDQARPLRGQGIVVVRGDVELRSGSNSFFGGLLYVDGDLTVRAPVFLQGTILARGEIDIQGVGGDYVEITHDPALIQKFLTVMGQYRYSKNDYESLPTMTDGRPDQTAETFVRGGRDQSRGNARGNKNKNDPESGTSGSGSSGSGSSGTSGSGSSGSGTSGSSG